MDGNSFLNAFMPTLPWWFLVITLVILATWAVVNRTRLWTARRHQAEHPGKALASARDALASVISDPLAEDSTRKQAVDAYAAVTEAITREKEIGN